MESLSMKLAPVFDWLLRTTLQAALLLCLILVIQLVLRGRLPIRWRYYLWLLLLIRMATPWLPESRISIFNWVPRSIQQGGIIEPLLQPHDARGMGFYLRAGAADTQEVKAEAAIVKFARMAPLLWLLGGAALAAYVGAANFRLWWLVMRERPLTNQTVLDLLEDCKAEMGIRNILGIVTTDKVKTAALFGFVRPRLLLPAGMVETLSLKELRYVFLHELAHLRRYDIYIGWLTSLLQVLHWFNPLVWFAFYRMQSDRELACDALVLSYASGGEPKDYGRTIVNLLERFSRPQRLPSMAGILETKSQLKRRIKMIAKFKKTSRPRWAGAMLLMAVLACVVLTNAYVAKADFIFGEPVNLKSVIPAIDPAHESIDCFSSDGLELYIESDRPGGSGGYDLWVLRRASTDDGWGFAENLGPVVNGSKAEVHASISGDGLALYFISERPGGYDAWDIYTTTRTTKNAPWGPPVNLGTGVNSSAVEAAPWISADGLELTFSSWRTGGYGGADIYVTKRATTSDPWGEPVNLGPLVNSAYNEYDTSLSLDGLSLLFGDGSKSPFRAGGYGGGDMWMARRASLSDPWQAPVNLGPRVNSPLMDAMPRISPDGRTLYFITLRDGSFENWQASILPVVDFNGDGIVDCVDICMLVDHWDTNDPLYDIAPVPLGDGIVDVQDLIVLTEHLTKKQVDPNAVTP